MGNETFQTFETRLIQRANWAPNLLRHWRHSSNYSLTLLCKRFWLVNSTSLKRRRSGGQIRRPDYTSSIGLRETRLFRLLKRDLSNKQTELLIQICGDILIIIRWHYIAKMLSISELHVRLNSRNNGGQSRRPDYTNSRGGVTRNEAFQTFETRLIILSSESIETLETFL